MAATARPSTVAGGTPSWSSPRPEKLTHEVLTMRRLTARAAMLHDELSRKQLAAESQRLLAWRIGLDADAHRVATAEQEHELMQRRKAATVSLLPASQSARGRSSTSSLRKDPLVTFDSTTSWKDGPEEVETRSRRVVLAAARASQRYEEQQKRAIVLEREAGQARLTTLDYEASVEEVERITRGQRENAEEEIRRQKALTARRAAARKDSGEEKVATKLALLKEVIAHTHTTITLP